MFRHFAFDAPTAGATLEANMFEPRRRPLLPQRAFYARMARSLALAFALVVGVFFGVQPARRAAKLRPVEALR